MFAPSFIKVSSCFRSWYGKNADNTVILLIILCSLRKEMDWTVIYHCSCFRVTPFMWAVYTVLFFWYRTSYPVGYEESLYQQHYAQGQALAGESYPTPNNHTPSRNGTRANSQRPTQPPPAPPSTNNSSNRWVVYTKCWQIISVCKL
jgi:hypothetical protein